MIMTLAPELEDALEAMPESRLKPLLLWMLMEGESIEAHSSKLNRLCAEVNRLTTPECLQLLARLSLTEQVRFAMMLEFGPKVAQRSSFQKLLRATTRRLSDPVAV